MLVSKYLFGLLWLCLWWGEWHTAKGCRSDPKPLGRCSEDKASIHGMRAQPNELPGRPTPNTFEIMNFSALEQNVIIFVIFCMCTPNLTSRLFFYWVGLICPGHPRDPYRNIYSLNLLWLNGYSHPINNKNSLFHLSFSKINHNLCKKTTARRRSCLIRLQSWKTQLILL